MQTALQPSAPIRGFIPQKGAFQDRTTHNERPHWVRQRQLEHNLDMYQIDWNARAADMAGKSHSSRSRFSLSTLHMGTAYRIGLRWRNQTELALATDGLVTNCVVFNRLTASEYTPVGVYEKRVRWEELRLRTVTDHRDRLAFAGVLVATTTEEAVEWADTHTNNRKNDTEHTAADVLAIRASKGMAYAQNELVGTEEGKKHAHMRRYLLNPALIPWRDLPATTRVLGRVCFDGDWMVAEGRLSDWQECAWPYELGLGGMSELKKWRTSPVHLTSIPLIKTEKEAGNNPCASKAALSTGEALMETADSQSLAEILKGLEITGAAPSAAVENCPAAPANPAQALIDQYVGVLVSLNGTRYDAQTLKRSAAKAAAKWAENMQPWLDGNKMTWAAPAIDNFATWCKSVGFVPQQLPHNFFRYNPQSGLLAAIRMLGQYQQAKAEQETAAAEKIRQKHAKKLNMNGHALEAKAVDLLERDARKGADERNRPFGFTAANGEIRSMYMPAGEWITTWILPRLRSVHAGNLQAMHTLNQTADLHGWYNALLHMRHYAEALVGQTTGHVPGTIENYNLANRFVRNALAWWLADPNQADFTQTGPGLNWFTDRKLDYAAAAGWRKKFTVTGLVRDNKTGQPQVEAFFAAFLRALEQPKSANKEAKKPAKWDLSYAKKVATDKGHAALCNYVAAVQRTGMVLYYMPVDPRGGNTLGFIMVTPDQLRDYLGKYAADPAKYKAIGYHIATMEAMNGEVPTVGCAK